MKRFVTAVFSHETNTFSSIQTPLKSFGRFSGGMARFPVMRRYQPTGARICRLPPILTSRKKLVPN